MTDRLKELQHQRARLQEHLDWLDREIALESGTGKPPPGSAAAARAARPPLVRTAADPHQVEAVAEQIFSQYRSEAGTVRENVRRGCLIYFLFAAVLVGAGVVALYFYTAKR